MTGGVEIDSQLALALKNKWIVDFSRPFESGRFTGFVLAIGPKFFLLASLAQDFSFETYVCLRMRDVRKLQAPAKFSEFYKAARRARGDVFPKRLQVDLANAGTIIDSLSRNVLTFFAEKKYPDVCVIGRLVSRNETHFELLELQPGATWARDTTFFRLSKVTRIDLPGPYERALLLVAGEKPAGA